LIAECGGVGRDFPWSIEKLSPTLAFFVVDGVEAGAQRCLEVLRFGGMGHTAGMHSRSREAAIEYGAKMPAARVVINSPTTHGAIGFSTDLPPSMTLGCGSWGGNVTSDNVSPIHLLDLKRVAFETKPVGAVSATERASAMSATNASASRAQHAVSRRTIKREEIAAIVDKFLHDKVEPAPQPVANPVMEKPTEVKTVIHQVAPASNGARALDFVSEDDVRRAIDRGEKIYVGAKTIITPSARDLGESKEVFAKIS
jgi:acetaldehyde dehydrogenase (acetylating)